MLSDLTQLECITTLDLLRDIIKEEMSFPDQKIYIYGQENLIPPSKGLYMVIEYKYSRVYSSNNLTPVVNEEIVEEQNINTQEFLTVQLFSRDFTALRRKEEVAMALKSIYAQQLQEKYAFKLSVNPQILDLSSLEASGMLYRFDVPVVCLTAYQKTKAIVPFDSFDTLVRVDDGTATDIVVEFTEPVNLT